MLRLRDHLLRREEAGDGYIPTRQCYFLFVVLIRVMSRFSHWLLWTPSTFALLRYQPKVSAHSNYTRSHSTASANAHFCQCQSLAIAFSKN